MKQVDVFNFMECLTWTILLLYLTIGLLLLSLVRGELSMFFVQVFHVFFI